MEDWRLATPPNLEMAVEQFYIARAIFTGFQQESAENITENYNSSIEIPGEFQLANYPNPFNGSTRISFNLPVSGSAFALRIYDSLGRLVKTFTGTDFTGNSVIWYGDDSRGNSVSGGIYFYSLRADSIRLENKMVLLK
jgi:flagellar hook assembly protein FlgD